MTTAELEQLVKIRRDGRIDLRGLYSIIKMGQFKSTRSKDKIRICFSFDLRSIFYFLAQFNK